VNTLPERWPVVSAMNWNRIATIDMKNLFDEIPSHFPDELTDVLFQNKSVRIERIVSTGHTSPTDFWFDQNEVEWVIVLKGEAKLLFQGDGKSMHMKPGDHVLIPPHRTHRVEWTSLAEPTIWLAVFCDGEPRET
jgi:cupin 2 domain-containing protein